jgi:serine/threonine protein kinase
LEEPLGQGGMGRLWRARTNDGAPVVVKTLHPRLVGSPLFVDLFTREAAITARLRHPGIIELYDSGVIDGIPFLAMEQIDGCNLNALCRALPKGKRLPVNAAVRIAIELTRALGYGHDWFDEDGVHRPVVHGDVSPGNVMVRRCGTITLIDFGVAQMGRRANAQRDNYVMGKSGYLAPELLQGGTGDERSDVFSAGVVLHELLAGRPLYGGGSDAHTLRLRAGDPAPMPPSLWNSAVTPALDAIVMRALSVDPLRRFPSATEMALALLGLDQRLSHCPRSQLGRFVAAALDEAEERPTSPIAHTAPVAPMEAPPVTRGNTVLARRPAQLAQLAQRPRRRPLRVAFAAAALASALSCQPSSAPFSRLFDGACELGASLIDRAVDLLPAPENDEKIDEPSKKPF